MPRGAAAQRESGAVVALSSEVVFLTRRALLQTELAMEWLLQQAAVRDSPAGGETPGEESFVADQDVRAPPVPPRARSGSRRLMLGGGCAQAVQMLTQMGFPADGVFDALRATNNDADEACTWLMESAAEADMSMGEWRPELACPTVGCRQRC